MIKSGLNRIKPDRRDYSLIHSFGITAGDVDSLPDNFSIFDGQTIPNQELPDTRFDPPVPPLLFGCVGETAAFDSGIQDSEVYRPDTPYLATYPYTNTTGRDMRAVLETLRNNEVLLRQDGNKGPKRKAYFNVYGANKITDFDAARIGVWINQTEKQGVWAGTFWYAEFAAPMNGILPLPSFKTTEATMHCHLITGWKTMNGKVYLEDISWQGENYGDRGKDYISEEIYNALLAQPYTAAFRVTKMDAAGVPIGIQANIDHVIYLLVQFIRNKFGV